MSALTIYCNAEFSAEAMATLRTGLAERPAPEHPVYRPYEGPPKGW